MILRHFDLYIDLCFKIWFFFFDRLPIWTVLSHQACADATLSGEPWKWLTHSFYQDLFLEKILLCKQKATHEALHFFLWRYTAWRQMKWAQRGTAAEMLLSSTLRTCECEAWWETIHSVCFFFLSFFFLIYHYLTWFLQLWRTRVKIWSSWL